jgi:hypothetical protein
MVLARGIGRFDDQLLAARPEAGATAAGISGYGNGAHDCTQRHQGHSGRGSCPATKQQAQGGRGAQRSPKMQKAGD